MERLLQISKAVSTGLTCCVLLSACDPGFAIIFKNNSSEIKKIQVIKDLKNKMPFLDSLTVNEVSEINADSTIKHEMIVIDKDTANNSFSFLLGKGKSVIIENGIGGPDMRQKIIINQKDTIDLQKDKKVFVNKKWMSTSVKISCQ